MIYAVKTYKTDSGIWVRGDGGEPRDDVLAFENKAGLDSYQDWLWSRECTGPDQFSGHNLIRVSRRRVEGWFGRKLDLDPYESVRFPEREAHPIFYVSRAEPDNW